MSVRHVAFAALLALGLGAVVTAFGLLAGALGGSTRADGTEPVVLYLTEFAGGRQQPVEHVPVVLPVPSATG